MIFVPNRAGDSGRYIMEKQLSTSRHFLKKYFLFILNIIEIQ